MVPPDSHRISRARCYLGTRPGGPAVFVYGALTLYGDPFQRPSTNHGLSHSPPGAAALAERSHNPAPTTPAGYSMETVWPRSAFARHYSRNHGCFLFLWVLRCFTSPRSLHTPYTFRRGSHHMTGAGFPHSDTLGSTLGWQLPEAYRSLPRPSSAPDAQASTVCPYQLGHTKYLPKNYSQRAQKKLFAKSQKMLASTVQFSTTHRCHRSPPTARPQPPRGMGGTTSNRPRTRKPPPPRASGGWGPFPQDPTARLRPPPHPGPGSTPHPTGHGSTTGRRRAGGRTGQRSTLEHHPNNPRPAGTGGPTSCWARTPAPGPGGRARCSLERR